MSVSRPPVTRPACAFLLNWTQAALPVKSPGSPRCLFTGKKSQGGAGTHTREPGTWPHTGTWPYTRTELAACCTARCCLLLLPAGLFDDLSNGLFDRLSDCPYDLPLIPPLIASLITKSAPRRGEGGQRPTRRAAPSPESDPAPPEIGRGSKRALTHRAGKSNRLM